MQLILLCQVPLSIVKCTTYKSTRFFTSVCFTTRGSRGHCKALEWNLLSVTLRFSSMFTLHLLCCSNPNILQNEGKTQSIQMMYLHCHYNDKKKEKNRKTFDKCCMKHNNRVVLFLQFLPQCMSITKSVRCIPRCSFCATILYTTVIVLHNFSYL